MTVLGIDVDSKKVELLNNGQSYIKHISADGIREMVDGGKFSATTDFSRIKEVEAVIICVPTPLTKNREPDISYVIETGRSIAPYLKSAEADLEMGDGRSKIGETAPISELPTANSQPLKKLIVLESTTYPGTTEEDLRAVLEEGSGMKAACGFSPRLFSGTGRSGEPGQLVRAGAKSHWRVYPGVP